MMRKCFFTAKIYYSKHNSQDDLKLLALFPSFLFHRPNKKMMSRLDSFKNPINKIHRAYKEPLISRNLNNLFSYAHLFPSFILSLETGKVMSIWFLEHGWGLSATEVFHRSVGLWMQQGKRITALGGITEIWKIWPGFGGKRRFNYDLRRT